MATIEVGEFPKYFISEVIKFQKRYTAKNIVSSIDELLKFMNISLPFVIDTSMTVVGKNLSSYGETTISIVLF